MEWIFQGYPEDSGVFLQYPILYTKSTRLVILLVELSSRGTPVWNGGQIGVLLFYCARTYGRIESQYLMLRGTHERVVRLYDPGLNIRNTHRTVPYRTARHTVFPYMYSDNTPIMDFRSPPPQSTIGVCPLWRYPLYGCANHTPIRDCPLYG